MEQRKKIALIVLVIVALVITVAGVLSQNDKSHNTPPTSTPTPSPSLPPGPYSFPIVAGTATLQSGSPSYLSYKFSVPSGASNIQLSINFTATGGTGNDLKVYVLNSNNFGLWTNRTSFTSNYYSGQVHTENTVVNLQSGGTYYLLLDNTFAPESTKTVSIQSTLSYIK